MFDSKQQQPAGYGTYTDNNTQPGGPGVGTGYDNQQSRGWGSGKGDGAHVGNGGGVAQGGYQPMNGQPPQQQQHYQQQNSFSGPPQQQQPGGVYVVDHGQGHGQNYSTDFVGDLFLYFLAVFIPPASVVVKRGCGAQFWINVLLSILGWIPGMIHAFYIIATTPVSRHGR